MQRVVDVKQKTPLFPVQGKFCLVLFRRFCSFGFRNLSVQILTNWRSFRPGKLLGFGQIASETIR